MSEVISAEERAHRREERRRKRQAEREAEERQAQKEAEERERREEERRLLEEEEEERELREEERKRQEEEEIAMEKSFKSSLNMNGNGSISHEEESVEEHDIVSPRYSRTKVPEVTLRKIPRANSVQDENDKDKEINEAEQKAAELRQKRAQEDEERWKEEEELRKADHDQIKRDLEALQEKSERRRRQKEEEEKKKQKEEEERKIREAEEAKKRKEEIERRRQEAGERMRNMMNGNVSSPMRPNYNITAAIAQAKMENKQSEDELKKERQRVLDQRIPPLKIVDSMSMEKLKEMAKDLHEKVKQVYAAKFDLEQRKKRQVYDLNELQERIKDLSKTKSAANKTTVKIDSGIVSKIKEQGFLIESKPKRKSFYQERNEGIAASGGVAGRMSLFQNKINGDNKPDIRKSGSPRSWKSPQADKCAICKKNVYTMEKLEINKNTYHRQCFKCVYCNKILSLSHYSIYLGETYCKPHQRKVEWESLQSGIKKGIDNGVNVDTSMDGENGDTSMANGTDGDISMDNEVNGDTSMDNEEIGDTSMDNEVNGDTSMEVEVAPMEA